MAFEWAERIYCSGSLLPPFSMRRFVGEARWDFGGKDFRNTGRHFADKLRDAGLHAGSRVLDIGSGCGRIAIPLTAILGPEGSYTGLELSGALVNWCSLHITSRYHNFQFVHCAVANTHYNPTGGVNPLSYKFPFADGAFDLIVASSVFTHLLPEVAVHYLRECARVLKPGGRVFATFYFIDDTIASRATTLRFEEPWGDYARVAVLTDPEAAIGFKVEWVLDQARLAALELEPPVRYGGWSGRSNGYSGQDVLIFRKT
jgi:SAM-dependent methyltransferase